MSATARQMRAVSSVAGYVRAGRRPLRRVQFAVSRSGGGADGGGGACRVLAVVFTVLVAEVKSILAVVLGNVRWLW